VSDENEDICGLCGEPGADKFAHPVHWPVPWHDNWWVILLQLLVIAAAILLCMHEAGCFDN
jgi:hypothetical protein